MYRSGFRSKHIGKVSFFGGIHRDATHSKRRWRHNTSKSTPSSEVEGGFQPRPPFPSTFASLRPVIDRTFAGECRHSDSLFNVTPCHSSLDITFAYESYGPSVHAFPPCQASVIDLKRYIPVRGPCRQRTPRTQPNKRRGNVSEYLGIRVKMLILFELNRKKGRIREI